MAPPPGYPGGGRFPSQPPPPPPLLLLLLLSLSKVRGDCTHPHVTNATLRSGDPKDSYPAGTVLRYRCIPGYEPIPRQTLSLTCLATSKWSIENPRFCQGRRCPTIDLENGRIVKSNDMRLGDEITLSCNEGYRMVGQRILRCVLIHNKVDWNRELPLCQRIPCFPPPNIANGRHSGRPNEDYNYGSAVTYTCNRPYSLIGSPTILCSVAADGVNGEWRPGAPECKAVACRRPEIKNGRLTTVAQPVYQYNSLIMFSCDPGYTLVGKDRSKCGADSAWHPPAPQCVKGTTTTTVTTKQTTSSTTHSATVLTTGGGGDAGGGGGEGGADGGGDEALDPGSGSAGGSEIDHGAQDSGSTAIIIGCLVGLLVLAVVGAAVWKYRSRMKTGEPEAPTSPGEFNQSVTNTGLEPTGSNLA